MLQRPQSPRNPPTGRQLNLLRHRLKKYMDDEDVRSVKDLVEEVLECPDVDAERNGDDIERDGNSGPKWDSNHPIKEEATRRFLLGKVKKPDSIYAKSFYQFLLSCHYLTREEYEGSNFDVHRIGKSIRLIDQLAPMRPAQACSYDLVARCRQNRRSATMTVFQFPDYHTKSVLAYLYELHFNLADSEVFEQGLRRIEKTGRFTLQSWQALAFHVTAQGVGQAGKSVLPASAAEMA